MEDKTKKIILATAIIIFITIISIFLNRPRIEIPEEDKKADLKGIVFAGMGEDSKLTEKKISELQKKFGNDVIESWSSIDFKDFTPSFHREFIPETLEYLRLLTNKKLREESGENSIKIKYPYVSKNSDLFSEVNLTFSGFDKKPVIFRIKGHFPKRLKNDLTSKFSSPEKIVFENQEYEVWKKDGSILITRIKKDRLNKDYLELTIYYRSNLENFFSKIKLKNQKEIQENF